MRGNGHFKLAAIQAAPVVFDREGSAEKACRLIKEAGAMGATIAAFGETWLPGYPFFAFSQMRPLTWQAMAEYLASAVDIPSPTTDKTLRSRQSSRHRCRDRCGRARHPHRRNGLLHTAVHREGRSNFGTPPQAQADVLRTRSMGRGRCGRAENLRATVCSSQRPKLLGA